MDASTLTRLVRNRALISNTYTKVPGVPSEIVMERAVGRQAFIQDKKLVQGCCSSGPSLGPALLSMVFTFGGPPPGRSQSLDPDSLEFRLDNAYGYIERWDGSIVVVDVLNDYGYFNIPGISEGKQVKLYLATASDIQVFGAANNGMNVEVWDAPNVVDITFASEAEGGG